MRGSLTKRGRNSWRLKYDLPRGTDGRREVRTCTVRGTRREAQARLTELLAAIHTGAYVAPSRLTVGAYVNARIDQWEAAGAITAATAERYRRLADNQIIPCLGAARVQALTTLEIETWHTTLRTRGRKDGAGGVAAATIVQAHRVLSKALREAVKFNLATRNVAGRDGQGAPRIGGEEIAILQPDKIGVLIESLRDRVLYPKVIVLLFTGMRRGELLALRWRNVDLDKKEVRVGEALEETRAHGLRFKTVKTRSGRRTISLPDIVVETLRAHRRAQLESRLVLGLGKPPDDALVFPAMDGGPASPGNLSGDWAKAADKIGMGDITLHALRHTHASQLIDAGVDVVTISKRLGHASPNITLAVYAHLFQQRDNKAAEAINRALAGPAPGGG